MSALLVACGVIAVWYALHLAYQRGRRAGWGAYRTMRWEEAARAGLPVPAQYRQPSAGRELHPIEEDQ